MHSTSPFHGLYMLMVSTYIDVWSNFMPLVGFSSISTWLLGFDLCWLTLTCVLWCVDVVATWSKWPYVRSLSVGITWRLGLDQYFSFLMLIIFFPYDTNPNILANNWIRIHFSQIYKNIFLLFSFQNWKFLCIIKMRKTLKLSNH